MRNLQDYLAASVRRRTRSPRAPFVVVLRQSIRSPNGFGHGLIGLVLTVACLVFSAGCDDRATKEAEASYYQQQEQIIKKQNAEWERQVKRIDEQDARYEAILTKWEVRTQRVDTLLDRWDQILRVLEERSADRKGADIREDK